MEAEQPVPTLIKPPFPSFVPPGVGGPVEKMSFFQMVPKSYLSVVMHSNRCEYDILKVSLEKIDHNLPIGRVKDENVPH